MEVTIIIPISREDYLEAIFARLEMLDCKREKTNIIGIVDGSPDLFVKARNFIENSKFNERLCIQFKHPQKMKNTDTSSRRVRIAAIHNTLKEYIKRCDFIFGIEDDTMFPANALKKMLNLYVEYPYAGMVQGVELGRWGVTYVGGWRVDDVYDPIEINSILPPHDYMEKPTVEEVDAGGLYCFLTRSENYMAHTFKPFGFNDLGADVDYGLALRQQGYQNYIDWSILCIHKSKFGDVSMATATPRVVGYRKKENRWRQKSLDEPWTNPTGVRSGV